MHSDIDRFNVHTEMSHHVTVLRIVPGMSIDTVSNNLLVTKVMCNMHVKKYVRILSLYTCHPTHPS